MICLRMQNGKYYLYEGTTQLKSLELRHLDNNTFFGNQLFVKQVYCGDNPICKEKDLVSLIIEESRKTKIPPEVIISDLDIYGFKL